MSSANFDYILGLIEVDISKQDTVMRASLPAYMKLAVTLRFFLHCSKLLMTSIYVSSIYTEQHWWNSSVH